MWIVDPASPKPYRKLIDLPAGMLTRGITWSNDGKSLILGTYKWTATSSSPSDQRRDNSPQPFGTGLIVGKIAPLPISSLTRPGTFATAALA